MSGVKIFIIFMLVLTTFVVSVSGIQYMYTNSDYKYNNITNLSTIYTDNLCFTNSTCHGLGDAFGATGGSDTTINNCSVTNSCSSILYNTNTTFKVDNSSWADDCSLLGGSSPSTYLDNTNVQNCSVDQSCDDVVYLTDMQVVADSVPINITYHENNFKHGNDTTEIRTTFTGGSNISITSGVIAWSSVWVNTIFVPYTGATTPLDLGSQNLSTSGIITASKYIYTTGVSVNNTMVSYVDETLLGDHWFFVVNKTVTGTAKGDIPLTQEFNDYDSNSMNISGITILYYANTTSNVSTDLNKICIRYKATLDTYIVSLYDSDDSTWESYSELTPRTSYIWHCEDIRDSSSHIIDGKVMMRITGSSMGLPGINRKLFLDAMYVSSGYTPRIGNEVDPIWSEEKRNYQLNITSQACTGTDKLSSFKNGTFTCTADAGGTGFESADYWNLSKEKLGYNNLTACGQNEILKYDTGEWTCGSDVTGGGGGGAGLWAVYDAWMKPNTTAGADNDIEVDDFNVTGNSWFKSAMLCGNTNNCYSFEDFNTTIPDTTIANCSVDQACSAVAYLTDKLGNDTTEIRTAFTAGKNISITSGVISVADSLFAALLGVFYDSLTDLQSAVSNDFHNLGGTDLTNSTTDIAKVKVNNATWSDDSALLGGSPPSTYLDDTDTTYTNSSFDLSKQPNTGNVSLSNHNLTSVQCIIFQSGGTICTG